MSMAAPKAWSDQFRWPATRRQLKPDVLLAAIDASSSPPYSSTSRIRAIGQPTSYSRPKTSVTPRA